jgi:hypothetical protein
MTNHINGAFGSSELNAKLETLHSSTMLSADAISTAVQA